MNVSADAGALQARPNPAVSNASKAQTAEKAGSSPSTASPAARPPVDSFTQAKVKAAPVALNAPSLPAAQAQAGQDRGGDPSVSGTGSPSSKYQHVDGTPFIQGAGDSNSVEWNDIDQNNLGDCYFMASMGEVAKQNPDLIKNAIKDNGDGSYTVRFYEKKGDGLFGWFGHHYEAKEIKVTPDFPMENGSPVFAGMADSDGSKQELWPALMEKAFAQWKGGYHDIEGGNGADAMSMLTGKDSDTKDASDVSIDQLNDMLNGGKAVVVSTFDNGKGKAPYDNNILVGDHEYMVTNVDKASGTITIRNPWGPNTSDVKLSIADFNKYLENVFINPTR